MKISQAHDIGVVEDIFATSGVMGILLNGEWRNYQRGDGIRFQADQPHGYRNTTDGIVQFLNTIHYPKTGIFNAD